MQKIFRSIYLQLMIYLTALQKEISWSFNIIEILNTYLVSFIVTKKQITNLKLINSNFCCDNSKKALFFWFAKTTKIKTKKFGIWFLVFSHWHISLHRNPQFYFIFR